jgi:predicted amino acid racemase
VEIDLGKIQANARCLVRRLGARRISVTGVTKAVCGHPDVAGAMLDGGVAGLADARIANVVRMRTAGITCPISMIRAPMVSEIGRRHPAL